MNKVVTYVPWDLYTWIVNKIDPMRIEKVELIPKRVVIPMSGLNGTVEHVVLPKLKGVKRK